MLKEKPKTYFDEILLTVILSEGTDKIESGGGNYCDFIRKCEDSGYKDKVKNCLSILKRNQSVVKTEMANEKPYIAQTLKSRRSRCPDETSS